VKARAKKGKKRRAKSTAATVVETSAVNLGSIRDDIDRIDTQIHELLNQRAKLAQRVGISKKEPRGAVASTAEFYRPEREAQVLRAVVERNKGPLRNEEVVRLFREIMSACLAQQEPLKVAFLGPEGTFSQQAVLKHFGHSVRALPLTAISEVFEEVQAGHADFGVVPVENSTEGTVNNTLDMFITSPLKICGEIELRIHQNLIGRMHGMESILRICSHQQSLAQCRHWLDEHLPSVERVPVSSNAEAARRARDEEGTAAIAGQAAAEVYGLNLIVPEIEDTEDNTTRFLVIGRKLFAASGNDKTTLLLSAGDTQSPGTLHRLLEPLARNSISMTRIESRPSRRRKWDYLFFIDVFGHADEPPLNHALDDLKKQSSLFRVLGSYPCAVL
jgi:chorismate mutase / prephenate dehydratase